MSALTWAASRLRRKPRNHSPHPLCTFPSPSTSPAISPSSHPTSASPPPSPTTPLLQTPPSTTPATTPPTSSTTTTTSPSPSPSPSPSLRSRLSLLSTLPSPSPAPSTTSTTTTATATPASPDPPFLDTVWSSIAAFETLHIVRRVPLTAPALLPVFRALSAALPPLAALATASPAPPRAAAYQRYCAAIVAAFAAAGVAPGPPPPKREEQGVPGREPGQGDAHEEPHRRENDPCGDTLCATAAAGAAAAGERMPEVVELVGFADAVEGVSPPRSPQGEERGGGSGGEEEEEEEMVARKELRTELGEVEHAREPSPELLAFCSASAEMVAASTASVEGDEDEDDIDEKDDEEEEEERGEAVDSDDGEITAWKAEEYEVLKAPESDKEEFVAAAEAEVETQAVVAKEARSDKASAKRATPASPEVGGVEADERVAPSDRGASPPRARTAAAPAPVGAAGDGHWQPVVTPPEVAEIGRAEAALLRTLHWAASVDASRDGDEGDQRDRGNDAATRWWEPPACRLPEQLGADDPFCGAPVVSSVVGLPMQTQPQQHLLHHHQLRQLPQQQCVQHLGHVQQAVGLFGPVLAEGVPQAQGYAPQCQQQLQRQQAAQQQQQQPQLQQHPHHHHLHQHGGQHEHGQFGVYYPRQHQRMQTCPGQLPRAHTIQHSHGCQQYGGIPGPQVFPQYAQQQQLGMQHVHASQQQPHALVLQTQPLQQCQQHQR